jgi:hypothetical protein
MPITTSDIHNSLDTLASEVQNIRVLSHDKTADQTSYLALILDTQVQLLAQATQYWPYLRYLEQLENIVKLMARNNISSVPGDMYIPIIFKDDDTQMSYRCKAANLIWQEQRQLYVNLNVGDVIRKANENKMLEGGSEIIRVVLALGALTFAAVTLSALAVLAFLVTLISLFGENIDYTVFSGLVGKFNGYKENFIKALYNAPSAAAAASSAIATLGVLSPAESYILGFFLKPEDCNVLFNPVPLPEPDDPVICVEVPLENCGYTQMFIGTPNMFDGNILYSGTITPAHTNYPAVYEVVIYTELPHSVLVTAAPNRGTLRFYRCDGNVNYDLSVVSPPADPMPCFGFSLVTEGEGTGAWTVTYTSEVIS